MRTCCFLHTNIPDTSFLCSLLTSILGTCMIYQVDFGKAVLYKNCNVSGKPTQAYNLLMVSRVFWQLKSSDQQRPPSTDFLARPRGLQCSSGRFKNRWPRSKDKVAFETGGKGLPYVFFFLGGWINQGTCCLGNLCWNVYNGLSTCSKQNHRMATSPNSPDLQVLEEASWAQKLPRLLVLRNEVEVLSSLVFPWSWMDVSENSGYP